MELFFNLALSLGVGLLIGIERGWHEREAAEGQRVAGIRTFALIGLLGGVWALLGELFGDFLLGVAFLALAAMLVTAYALGRHQRDYGITTLVAALLTFGLGALAVRGYATVAAAGAVVTTALLGIKPILHGWLRQLERRELMATVKLLLISVVVLPVLPNRGFGPWQALNPYEIWWLVVLIAGISFAGYVLTRLVGIRRGLLLTAVFGGLVSSTAVSLNFARYGRQRRALQRVLSLGVLLAAATMFPRILLEVAVVNPPLLQSLFLPLGAMTLSTLLAGLWLWRRREASPGREAALPLRNPFELAPALQFGLLLGLIMLLSEAFRAWYGTAGVYLLAAASGLADVDAITLSLARLSADDLPLEVAARGIALAAMVNTLVKGALVTLVAGAGMARYVLPAFVAVVAVGAAVLAAG
ncbi:MgtC/SapB family protein [Thiohalobacter sp. IOR34]|uniref:MgtC/SapB family protein n=1 Tax=Thiohalobacter sp. IOR34 TaxID=3057176 RepID=UPI0025B01266|nr:MgtC/SapB family protein [Thiohalobacter sp. IOR34]WJW75314.1 MgtC/SapB family protein [Thiohalobacter sp. IOR34]